MPLSAAQLARIIAPLGEQTTRQSGVRTRVLSLSIPLVVGNQTYRNIGFQPKGLIFYGSPNGTSQTPINPASGAYFSFGAADGTTQWITSVGAIESTTSTSQGGFALNNCVGIGLSSGIFANRAALVSFSADDGGSFTLNWVNIGGTFSNIRYLVLLIGGGDVSFACGNTLLGTATGPLVVTSGLSFQPDLVGLMMSGIYASPGVGGSGSSIASAADVYASYGWATATDEYCTSVWHDTGQADSVVYSAFTDTLFRVIDTAEKARCSLTSLDANGFTINRDANDGLTNSHFGWVAIKAPGIKLGLLDSPTTPGVTTLAVPGIVPRGALLFGANRADTSGTIQTTGHLTIGASDGTNGVSYSMAMEHGLPTSRQRARADLSYLYRSQITYGDNLWQTGPTILNGRFASEQIDLAWERVNSPQLRVIQTTAGFAASPITVAATTAGSTLLVMISHSAGTLTTPFAPNDALNGAYTIAVNSGGSTLSAKVFYFHNSAAGVTSINLGYAGTVTFYARVVEIAGLVNEAPLVDFIPSSASGFTHRLQTAPGSIATTREGYLVGAFPFNGAIAAGPSVPGFAGTFSGAAAGVLGLGLDGLAPDLYLQAGIVTTARALSTGVITFFRAPTVTPRKIVYVVFGEAVSGGDLSVNVSDTVSVADVSTVVLPELFASRSDTVTTSDAAMAALQIMTIGDALQRRSMASTGLFFLRGGVVPGGD